MKHAKPRRLRYRTIRKKRFRMRGGVGENVALRVFGMAVSDGAEYLVQILTRLGSRLVQGEAGVAAGRAAGEAGVVAGRAAGEAGVVAGRAIGEAGIAAGRAAGEAGVAAGRAAGQLLEQFSISAITRFGQATVAYVMASVSAAGPAVMSAGGALAGAALQGLARDPGRARRIFRLLQDLYSASRQITVDAAPAAVNVVVPRTTNRIGQLVQVGEGLLPNASTGIVIGAEGTMVNATGRVVAAIRPPIPTTGQISFDFIRGLFKETPASETQKLIADFLKAAAEETAKGGLPLRLPVGITEEMLTKGVRAASKIADQQKAFFETLVANGKVPGTPAEIIAEAGKLLGKDMEVRISALVNPVKLAEKALADAALNAESTAVKAAIEAAKATGKDVARVIADRGMTILAEAEAKIVQRAIESGTSGLAGNPLRLSTILRAPLARLNGQSILGAYDSLFGRTPLQLTQGLVPTQAEVAALLRTSASPEGLARYNLWLPEARAFFETQLGSKLADFNRVMRPEVMSQFRTGMQNIFMNNPTIAEGIFEDFVIYVVPNLSKSTAKTATTRIGNFLTTMNRDPGMARSALDTLITQFASAAQALATSEQRALGTLPARLLGRAAVGGTTGSVGLFLYHFQNTPSGTGGFLQGMSNRFGAVANGARDRIDQWFGIRLWQSTTPDSTLLGQMATAGGFSDVNAMIDFLATAGRQYLWNNMFTIFASIGGTVTGVYTFFNRERPPTLEKPLTPEQLTKLAEEVTDASSSSSSSSSAALTTTETRGGQRKKRKTVRKYR